MKIDDQKLEISINPCKKAISTSLDFTITSKPTEDGLTGLEGGPE